MVNQTKLSSIDNPEYGNCLAACVASLTGCTIEEYEAFEDKERVKMWYITLSIFLHERGYECEGSENSNRGDLIELSKNYEGIDGYVIMCGGSPRGEWVKGGHCVIYKDGKMVHDPHPSKAGLESLDYFLLIKPIRKVLLDNDFCQCGAGVSHLVDNTCGICKKPIC